MLLIGIMKSIHNLVQQTETDIAACFAKRSSSAAFENPSATNYCKCLQFCMNGESLRTQMFVYTILYVYMAANLSLPVDLTIEKRAGFCAYSLCLSMKSLIIFGRRIARSINIQISIW